MKTNPTLSIVTIATGKYLQYAFDLVRDLDINLRNNEEIEVIILTDSSNIDEACAFQGVVELTTRILEIEQKPWPEITLFRYAILAQAMGHIKGDYVMWVDADMRLLQEWDFKKIFGNKSGLWFSRHPGYRYSFNKFSLFRSSVLKNSLSEIFRNAKQLQFALGTWENRKSYAAFVSAIHRTTYFHGALWAGDRQEITSMIEELSRRTEFSYSKGEIPIWHDESFLNWFASKYPQRIRKFPRHFSAWDKSVDYSASKSYFLSVDKSTTRESK